MSSAGSRARRSPNLPIAALLAAGCLVVACESSPEPLGQLILSIDTDMALPQRIDRIHIQVLVRGRTEHDQAYVVGDSARDAPVPATLTLLAGSDPTLPVTVRVAGRKESKWRTFREAITTVPAGRIASLRMPLQWLCDGMAQSDGDDAQFPKSTCSDGSACRAGSCVPSEISSDTLDDYRAEDIFGGAAEPEQGQCFDTLPCMANGELVEPDSDCTIERPDSERINVALRVAEDGICDDFNSTCFVPLDANSEEGWTLTRQRDRIQLPTSVCEKLAARTISAVYVSSECQSKVEGMTPCGKWSSVGSAHAVRPDSSSEPAPSATRVTTLPTGGTLGPCCPLMQNDDRLYACVCESATDARLYEVLPLRQRYESLRKLILPEREFDFFAATMFDGTLFWNAANAIQRTRLTGDDAVLSPLGIPSGAIYETASLLADASGVYALASGLGSGSPVQMLKLAHDGTSQTWDTGGSHSVLQFDEDSDGVYVATVVDEPIEGGERFMRHSSVVRLNKANGERTTVFPETTITTADKDRGGYSGVQADQTSLFALFGRPAEDGSLLIQLQRGALGNGANGAPEVVYESSIDPDRTRIRLQGVVDGAAVLTRIESESSTLRSTSVLIFPLSRSAPRIVADFAGDAPVPGLAADADNIYWLNGSGKLYSVPRSALR